MRFLLGVVGTVLGIVGCNKQPSESKPKPEVKKPGPLVLRSIDALQLRAKMPNDARLKTISAGVLELTAANLPTVIFSRKPHSGADSGTDAVQELQSYKARLTLARQFVYQCECKDSGKVQDVVKAICDSMQPLGKPDVQIRCTTKKGDAKALTVFAQKYRAGFVACLPRWLSSQRGRSNQEYEVSINGGSLMGSALFLRDDQTKACLEKALTPMRYHAALREVIGTCIFDLRRWQIAH